MRGQPVWLASLSRRSPITGRRLATGNWSKQTVEESIDLLRRMIGPAGDRSRERIFRMNVTMCLHRALTAAEVAALPAYFHADPSVDLAGGPVEVLWESEPGWPSTMPCHDPRRYLLDPRDTQLWVPLDCGACPPCLARADLDREMDKKVAAAPAMFEDLVAQVLSGGG